MQDSLRNWTSLPWWTMQSMTADIWSSPNADPHLLNSRFVVITADCLGEDLEEGPRAVPRRAAGHDVGPFEVVNQ